jgi:PTS system nitrogen regulatory IIA component
MITLKKTSTQSLAAAVFPAGETMTTLVSRAALRLRPALLWRAHRERTTPGLRIAEVVPESLVIPALNGGSKEEVLHELVEHMAGHLPDVDAAQLLEVLWKRERLGSTAIGNGVAIPHGTLPGLRAVVRGAFGRHPRGVDFQSPDGTPTKLFFLLVASEDPVGHHFKVLARVSRLLRDAASRDRLLAVPDRPELYRSIREEDEKY